MTSPSRSDQVRAEPAPNPSAGEGKAIRPSRRGFIAMSLAAGALAATPMSPAVSVAAPPPAPAPPLTLSRLKDLSERAMPVLRQHFGRGDHGEAFLAEEGENYHGLRIHCDCPDVSSYGCLRCAHPLAGTPMLGGVSGYYEPEWDEDTAYEVLRETLWWSDRPDTMTDSEWVGALAIIGMTPASHAERVANFEREMEEMASADPPASRPVSDTPDGAEGTR